MAPQALWFAFFDNRILTLQNGTDYAIPTAADLSQAGIACDKKHYLGTLDGRQCYALELKSAQYGAGSFQFKGLRGLFGKIAEDYIWIAGRANQIVTWSRNHRFCGSCGTPTQDKEDERAILCPACGLISYPRISPAIIVAVVKEKSLLLARAKNFKLPFYSVLAGFVEPGETLEQAVKREVREEVGIGVKNVRYFGSQPWPFPDSLMVGFTADYQEGEIRIDPAEIKDAGWFEAGSLPQIPPRISIARQLIDWFIGTAPR